jgi:hypothetical protein
MRKVADYMEADANISTKTTASAPFQEFWWEI